jgi:PHD/YefM family antitoxin component YafN of YafNO toxin-antitoxin module
MEKAVISDATEYLLSTETNREWLDAAIAEAKRGEGVEIKLEDLWK